MNTKRERGLAGGQERDKLHMALSNASFAEFERAFLALGRKRLKIARGDSERLEVKRRTAEDILLGAYGRPCSWQEFQRALRRLERLGYTDALKRVEAASYFVLSVSSFPEQEHKAREMLDEAERRLRLVRKGHVIRKEGMRELKRLRKMTGWAAALPSRTR